MLVSWRNLIGDFQIRYFEGLGTTVNKRVEHKGRVLRSNDWNRIHEFSEGTKKIKLLTNDWKFTIISHKVTLL